MTKELNNMNGKKLWDVNDVYSLDDLLKDKNISEAMLGRVFAILGIKGEELDDAVKQLESAFCVPRKQCEDNDWNKLRRSKSRRGCCRHDGLLSYSSRC